MMKLILITLWMGSVLAQLQYTKGYRDTLAQVRKNPHHLASLIIITTATDCQKCEQALEIYEQFAEAVTNVVKTYVFDCKVIQDNPEERSIIPACDVNNVDQLPAITFLSPPKKEVFTTPQSYTPIENQFRGTLSLAALIEAAEKSAPIYSVIANEQEYLETIFLKDTTIPNKVLLSKPDEKIPLWWRGISAKFINRLEFAEVDSDEPYIYKAYKVPRNRVSVIVLEFDPVDKKYHPSVFQGEVTYEALEAFLDRFALKKQTQKEKSIYEEDPSKWKKVEEIQIHHVKALFDVQEQWIALHIRVDNQPHPLFKEFRNNFTFRGLVKFYEVRCTNYTQVATLEKILKMESLQQLIILPFLQKTTKNYIVVREKDTFKQICEFMFDSVTRQASLNHFIYENILNELQQARKDDLFPVLWFYRSGDFFWNVAAVTYSSMSKYQKHLKFLFLKDPNKEQREQWEVARYPHLTTFASINLETGQHQKYDFEGAQTIPNLISYLNQVAQENEKSKLEAKPIPHIQDQEELEKTCLNMETTCVIAFLDTVREGKFNTDLNSLHTVLDFDFYMFKDRHFQWLWIDGRCHPEMLKQFNIQGGTLPQLILYYPPDSKFTRFDGEFSLQQLVKFVDTMSERKNRRKYKLVDDFVEIREQNCTQIRLNQRKQYLEEKEMRQRQFAEAERQRDLENAKIARIKEQKRILEDDDEDDKPKKRWNDHSDDDWDNDDL